LLLGDANKINTMENGTPPLSPRCI